MKVVNWLDLKLQEPEIKAMDALANGPTPVRDLCQVLVATILKQYPWNHRDDLINLYHPAATYHQGEWIGLVQYGLGGQKASFWQIAKIKRVDTVQNPFQGTFEVVEFESSHQNTRACNIPDAKFPVPDYSSIREVDIRKLTSTVVNEYYDHLVMAISRLISAGKLTGKIIGQNYIPYRLDDIISDTLPKIFNNLTTPNPWVTESELKSRVIEAVGTYNVSGDELNDLIKVALNYPKYTYMGNGYWTTAELYKKMLREIPRGVPAPHIRSVIDIWTEDDYQHLSLTQPSADLEESKFLDEEDGEVEQITSTALWQAPVNPVKLPTLTYQHITQAYFPVGKVINAFHPEAKLIRLRINDGEYQDFLLNRDNGHLVAVNEELFFNTFREGPPAGSYLWLTYEGNERYKVAPRLLEEPRLIPCKLVFLDQGKLVIENSELSMKYDGNPSVFKADLRFNDLKAFFREARRSNLSVRDAIIESIKELANKDPDRRAHVTDIFNLVFLKRMCSPRFVNLLLYTQPCFKSLGHGYFQYVPQLGHPDFQSQISKSGKSHPKIEPSKIIRKVETPTKTKASSIQNNGELIGEETEQMPVIPRKDVPEITTIKTQDDSADQISQKEGETEKEPVPPFTQPLESTKEPIIQIVEQPVQKPELELTQISETPKRREVPKTAGIAKPPLVVRMLTIFVILWRGLLGFLKKGGK